MKLSESLSIIKALADNSRLLLINALLEKPQYVEELSKRLNLAASTVSFHLKKLERAHLVYKVKEQYYVMYRANAEALAMTLRDVVDISDIEKMVQEERLQKYRQKVLWAFFDNGKLRKIPTQQKKRRIVLEEIAKQFEIGRTYREQEVNTIISEIHEDYCTIRRELIGSKIMGREKGKYWLVHDQKDTTAQLQKQKKPQKQEQSSMDKRKR